MITLVERRKYLSFTQCVLEHFYFDKIYYVELRTSMLSSQLELH